MVFQSAETDFGRRPKRTFAIELNVPDMALAQPVGGSVGDADLTVLEIPHPTVTKCEPQTSRRISDQSTGPIGMAQLDPWDPFDQGSVMQMKKAVTLADPDVSGTVPGNRMNLAGNRVIGFESECIR